MTSPCSWKSVSAQLALSGCYLRPGIITVPGDLIKESKEREVTLPICLLYARVGPSLSGAFLRTAHREKCALLRSDILGPSPTLHSFAYHHEGRNPEKGRGKRSWGARNSRLEGAGGSGTTPKPHLPPAPCFPALGFPWPWSCHFLCQNSDALPPCKYTCPGVQTRAPPAYQTSVDHMQHVVGHCA